MEKLISVIIPAYNAEDTIERCIKSVKDREIEIIIVVDGATDNTLSICRELKKQDERIIIIEQENKGQLEARETGILNAHGEYIMFLDADDCFEKCAIKRIREIIQKYEKPDLIRFRYRKLPDDYEQYKYFEKDETEILKEEFREKVYPIFLDGYMLNTLWVNCIKKEVIKNINIKANRNIKYGEDLLVNLEIFSNIQRAVFVNDILYNYIYQENSVTTSRNVSKLMNNLKDCIKVYSLLYQYIIKWDMVSDANLQKVSDRITKETDSIIELILKTYTNIHNMD